MVFSRVVEAAAKAGREQTVDDSRLRRHPLRASGQVASAPASAAGAPALLLYHASALRYRLLDVPETRYSKAAGVAPDFAASDKLSADKDNDHAPIRRTV
jgi:hypothetical protein